MAPRRVFQSAPLKWEKMQQLQSFKKKLREKVIKEQNTSKLLKRKKILDLNFDGGKTEVLYMLHFYLILMFAMFKNY